MDLKSYLKGKSRREFAEKIGTSLNYINNLCQRPTQAGKNIALRIEQATGGAVTRMELLYPTKGVNHAGRPDEPNQRKHRIAVTRQRPADVDEH